MNFRTQVGLFVFAVFMFWCFILACIQYDNGYSAGYNYYIINFVWD